jgi:hypothetical protein
MSAGKITEGELQPPHLCFETGEKHPENWEKQAASDKPAEQGK